MKKKIFDQFVKIICARFGITESVMFSRDRSINVVAARQLLFYMCYERRWMRYGEIQEYIIDRGLDLNTSSIRNGVNKIRELAAEDQDYEHIIALIDSQIKIS